MRQIERLRCRHRIRVLQAHEDTTKENAVSRQRIYLSKLSKKGILRLTEEFSSTSDLHLFSLCVSVQLRVVTPDVSISPENLGDIYDLFKVSFYPSSENLMFIRNYFITLFISHADGALHQSVLGR